MEKFKFIDASAEFKKGNYLAALKIYRKLGDLFGYKIVSANIAICENRLKSRKDSSVKNINFKANIKEIYQLFFKKGNISLVKSKLEDLLLEGFKFDKGEHEFKARIDGFDRLRSGCFVPPRKSDINFPSRTQCLLYCLHQSLPYTTNGYSTRSHGVAVGLNRSGWKVHAVTRPGFPWDLGISKLKEEQHRTVVDSIIYDAIPGLNHITTPRDHYLAEAANYYQRQAQSTGAQLIIAASNHITALPALIAARSLGLPFVYEVRGLWEVTHASLQPEWANSESYQLMRALEKQAAIEADLIITLTEELVSELVSWGVPRNRIELVPNAVDLERFSPKVPDDAISKQLCLQPNVPVIGYAGSVVAYEGLELLLEALAMLKKRNQDFIFVLVGDGQVVDAVKERAKALGLEYHCRFTGRVPFEQVPNYLSCMDIMPVPRLSLPVTEMVSALKPLEAMAMGKAVVLSDVSPHKTMAGNNERAYLFSKGNPSSLCDVLQHLIVNVDERTRLGQAARAWVQNERSWNHVTKIYADALTRLTKPIFRAIKDPQEILNSPELKLSDKIKLSKKFKAISIMDEISEACWKYELTAFPINRNKYQQQIETSTADFCFLESCWKGNKGAWQYAFTSPELKHKNSRALLDLILKVKDRKIPLVFWNKEDPMHYDRYLPIAKSADIIFTTDSKKIPDYQRDVPGAKVYAVPFAAQQRICNPANRFRQPAESICFAGSYYGVGHEERKRQMDALLPSIIDFNGAIYDRMSTVESDRYKFPPQYMPFIRPAVPFTEIVKLYKQFKVFLNVNTIIDSPTMMSRRVYELLACGTPVVSTPSKAIEEQFSGIVQIAKDAKEAKTIIERLLTDENYWEKTSHLGYREVMKKHTYAHRMRDIENSLGYETSVSEPLVSIITCTRRPHMIDRIVENMIRQNHPNCELILVLQDFSKNEEDDLITKLKAPHSNIKHLKVIINNDKNTTLGERFNDAATYAKGEYIAKMDDDDFYFSNYISDMIIPFSFGNYAMVGKRELYMYLSASNKLIKRFPSFKHREVDFVAGPTFVIKASVFKKFKFEARNTGEDSSFLEKIKKSGLKIYAADPFNFVQFRDCSTKHTWKISDEEILKDSSIKVISNFMDQSKVNF